MLTEGGDQKAFLTSAFYIGYYFKFRFPIWLPYRQERERGGLGGAGFTEGESRREGLPKSLPFIL